MKALPPNRGSWSELAALFAPDIEGPVSQAAGRIETMLGATRERPLEGNGEVDGYSGFVRRGSYERLLLSEWLLADEVPEEFLRRAATGTHAFHALARRTRSVRRNVLVLLDAGPEQVGAPRLGHVAALVALDRRAARAHATLVWGFLEGAEQMLRTRVDASTFAGFVAAHTDRAPGTDATMRALARESARELGPFAELWLVGSRELEHQAGRDAAAARRIVIEETFDARRRALDFRVEGQGARSRSVTIDLPEASICVRMLRDPFGVNRSERATLAPITYPRMLDLRRGFQLSSSGSRLLGVTMEGHAIALGVGGLGSRNAPHARLLTTAPGATVIGVGYLEKKLVVATLMGNELVVRTDGPRTLITTRRIPPEVAVLAEGPVARIVASGAAADTLVLIHPSVSIALRELTPGVRSAMVAPDRAVVVHRDGKAKRGRSVATYSVRQWQVETVVVDRIEPEAGESCVIRITDADHPACLFTASDAARGGSYVAYRQRGTGVFRVLRRAPDGKAPLDSHDDPWPTFPAADAVGLVASIHGPALVHRPNERELRVVLIDRTLFHRELAHPITCVACASEAPILAFASDDGEVTVIDVDLRRPLLKVQGRRG